MITDDCPGMTVVPKHRVVIVGAGFGGLQVVEHLRGVGVDIILVDQRNHHLFQPLLYQVATASLTPSEIAWPIRAMVRDRPEVSTVLGTVVGVDTNAREVHLGDDFSVPYDTLILATGARHDYFGHDDWEPFAPGLKTVEDATRVRGQILLAFEKAERETNPSRRASLLTFVVIGAVPTGSNSPEQSLKGATRDQESAGKRSIRARHLAAADPRIPVAVESGDSSGLRLQ